MIVAVDFDGTLEQNGIVNDSLIKSLMLAQKQGNVIILWTCRHGKRLQDAVNVLLKRGFRPNYINCNTPETIRKIGYDSRKIFADVYIDDKAQTCIFQTKFGQDI